MASLLNARTAVITGGAQGLGLAIGQRFVAEGARVVLGDVNLEATEVAAKRLGGDDVALAVRCDVTQADDVDILIRTAVERFGGLDVMVNNAGITRDATMRTMTEEQFDQVIAVHLKGTWNGTRLAAAIMRERKRGAIVNMSSVSGKVGMVGQTNYSAAKAGIVGMTKAAAKELAHLGIRVNAIAPGLIRSAMTEAMPQRIWDQKLAEVPMGRAGEPSEVASVAVFLASDLSSYMTGTVLDVTGGRSYDTEIIATVRQFVKKEIFPNAPALERGNSYPQEIVDRLGVIGLLGRRLQGYRHHRVHSRACRRIRAGGARCPAPS